MRPDDAFCLLHSRQVVAIGIDKERRSLSKLAASPDTLYLLKLTNQSIGNNQAACCATVI
jgi:hypothetical protein